MVGESTDGMDLPAGVIGDIKLAVTEACTNAIQHAYPGQGDGQIDVTLKSDESWLRVVVRDYGVGVGDYGVGIDQSVHRPGLGIGLPIIEALTATLQIEECDPGTRIAMTFALSP